MLERITANPEILSGKPIIKGTRISVALIFELLASGMTEQDILEEYPRLSMQDIQACFEYASKSIQNEIYIDLQTAA